MKYLKSSKAFTLLELMVVTAVLAILMAIAIPNYISFRNKSFCTQAETDADHIAAAIADYFGTPQRVTTPTVNDLKIQTINHVEILGEDPNFCITIHVTDISGRCPLSYQNASPGWDSNYVFTKSIK